MSQHGCPERLSNRSKGFQEDGPSQPTMEVLVETLTGTAFEMTVSPSDTVFAIKSKIFRVEGIPVSQQHLLYNLKELEDSMSLRELSIGDGARLRLVLGMRGGPVSTRRLPPPAPSSAEPWPDIERLLDSNRDDIEWTSSGCKVTVLVFRDGERVNMLRVRENRDGTYSPLDGNKYSGRASQVCESGAEPAAGVRQDNAVTMGKMMELRRRMEALALQRAPPDIAAGSSIQKPRSEEALRAARGAQGDSDDGFAALYDNTYTRSGYFTNRYSYDCGFESRYRLVPARGDAEPEAARLRPRRQGRREGEEAAILEECGEEATLQPAPRDLGLVGGVAWRGGHSASALQLRPCARRPPLHDALLSSSTSELENLKRNSRILPALSRARPREHLHLSDEGLHLRRETRAEDRRDFADDCRSRAEDRRDFADDCRSRAEDRRDFADDCRSRAEDRRDFDDCLTRADDRRNFTDERQDFDDCRSRAEDRRDFAEDCRSVADDRRVLAECRREVGSERRERRIEKIAELDGRLGRFDVPQDQNKTEAVEVKEKKIRVRCGLCRKRLSVSTVHRCRCGASFCAPHRYAEVHGCDYDYKATRAVPLAAHEPRLPRI